MDLSSPSDAAMNKLLAILALPLFASPALAGDMKAGLWEFRTTKQIVDGQDVGAQMAQMQQQMANLPPEQRKQMEAMMARQGVGLGPAGTVRMCITEEMAKRDVPVIDPEDRCKVASMSRSGNTMRYEIACDRDGQRMAGKGESTVSDNSMRNRMDATMTDATGRHTMQMESHATWLGADCRGLAPAGANQAASKRRHQ
jgi:hypothetical protein